MVELKIHRLDKTVDVPQYMRDGDAAFDLRSAQEKLLAPGEKAIIKTGLQMAIPAQHVGLIWDRSGLAAKHSIHCLAGVIDSQYRGEVGVVLKNLGDAEFLIEKNMRIAQMIVQPFASARIVESEEKIPEDTERGAGGFGHTGLK